MMKSNKNTLALVGLTLLYIVIIAMNAMMSAKLPGHVLVIGWARIETNSIQGCVTVLQVMITVLMTCIDWKAGSCLAYIMLSANLVSIMGALFGRHQIGALPGVIMLLCGLMFVTILRKRLKVIDANNKFYRQISLTDALTGLQNRRGFRATAGVMIEEGKPFYLMFLDLDNFKYVNDTLGHVVGDSILQLVATRCTQVNIPGSIVARNGGDEFVIIIPDSKKLDIEKCAEEYLEAIEKEIYLEEENIRYNITASVGVSHYPTHSRELDGVINYADAAMYEAKEGGRNRCVLFTSEMAESTIHNKYIEEQIKYGLQHGLFYLEFQPQYELKNHSLRGFEALLRLKDRNGNIIGPTEFIPVAEKSDLILEIDLWVLKNAMLSFKEYALRTAKPFVVSINISAKHISRQGLEDEVRAILEETQFPERCLEIEITEYCMIQDIKGATATLNRLHQMGIQIALDDFGTGYASLSNLTKLPIDTLKIDRSFVEHLTGDVHSIEFVEAMISMGHMMHCDIVSEGVETEEQLKILGDSHCDIVQGFIWGRPLPLEEAMKLCE